MSKKMILAHYMPWFTDGSSEDAGLRWVHWRSGGDPSSFALDDTDEHGRRKIASHYYPSCGPYCSRDSNVIHRHLRLMTQHGIDGIIVNWYGAGTKPDGNGQYEDYEVLHKAVMTIWACVKEHNKGRDTKFKFALCFDGGSLKVVQKLEESKETSEGPYDYAKRSLELVDRTFFGDETGTYLKHGDRDPRAILLVFQSAKESWIQEAKLDSVCKALSHPPLLLSQDEKASWADGAFAWPKVDPVKNEDKDRDEDPVRPWSSVGDDLTKFYAYTRNKSLRVVMGVAFPGFRDIFRVDNRSKEHKEIIEREGGDTYRRTLRLALSQRLAQYVQIATWNDWEEGTQIEPAVEFGDRELRSTRELLGPFGLD